MGKYRPIIVTADCGSLTRAGKILGYAQPNMGSIVTRFENELGVKLFTRSKHGVTLTKTGEKLVDIMRQIDHMEDYLHEVSVRARTERFRVGVFQSIANQWMPQIMAEFLAAYPDTVVQMENLSCSQEAEFSILNNRLDCAFFLGSSIPNELDHISLITEPYFLLVPADCPLAESESLSLAEVAGTFPYIHTDEEFDREDSYKWIRQKLMERDVVKISAPENSTVISLVSQGLGMSLLPKLSLSSITAEHQVKVIPLNDAPTRTVSLLFPKEPENPTLTSFFLDLLQTYVQEWQ